MLKTVQRTVIRVLIKNNMSTSSKNVTLVVTHQCNLRCRYCYEKHKDNHRMTLSKALEIVDYELNLDDNIDKVEIDFFGGEPLLEFELIKQVIEYVKQKKYPKEYIFFITTNGVLLDEEKKTWLKQNSDYLQVGLSLDGTKEMHDINRSNSFDKIDLAFFKETYKDQDIKMTISDKTLPYLFEGVRFCEDFGFEVSCNLAYGIDWNDPINEFYYERELKKLIDYYLDHPSQKPCALLEVNRLKGVLVEDKDALRHCGAGWAMKSYDYDGTFYPCQHFLPISIGEDLAKTALDIDFENQTTNINNLNKECQTCILKNVCPTCYGENFSATHDINKKDMSLCKLNKIHFKALGYFVSKGFERGYFKDMDKNTLACLLKAAIKINQEIDK